MWYQEPFSLKVGNSVATPTLHENDEVHQPYVYVNNSQYATYCMASFESKTLRMKIPAILDTGSSVSLIPYSYVKGREVEKETHQN